MAAVSSTAPPFHKAPPFPNLLRQVADTVGTPTYVYFEQLIRQQCDALRAMTEGLPAHLHYAMKANFNPALLRIFADEGFGVDAVSPGEMELALRVGFTPDRVLYSPNFMADGEQQTAHERGVLLNIGELSRLERYGAAYPGSDVCVRLNPLVGGGHHAHVITAGAEAKFGIPLTYVDQILAVAARYQLRIIGLHQHVGSGILDTRLYWDAMQVLLDVAPRFPALRFLNFGGGFGIAYRPSEVPITIDAFRRDVNTPLKHWLDAQPRPITVMFEPGRFLMAEAGVLLTRVTALKPTETRTFAGTDSGFNHLLRPTMYGSYHDIANLSAPDGPLQAYDVAGNICESGDLFARNRDIARIHEGDLLAVLDAGAYGIAMASEYNLRPFPAEVLIPLSGSARIIRPRRTPDDVVTRLLAEST